MRWLWVLAMLTVCGCSSTWGTVLAEVEFGDDPATACVTLELQMTASGEHVFAPPVARRGGSGVQFAVEENDARTGPVRVLIHGWPTTDCAGPETVGAFAPQSAVLAHNTHTVLVFTSSLGPAPTDGGHDGGTDAGSAPDAGPDGGTDAGACDLSACGAAPACSDTPSCGGDGGCVWARADAGSACDDGLACTSNDRCSAQGLCAGACAPPPACFTVKAEVCTGPGGGCELTPSPGDPCGDGGVCRADGVCSVHFGATSNFDPNALPYPDAGWVFSLLSDGGECWPTLSTDTLGLVVDPAQRSEWCAPGPLPQGAALPNGDAGQLAVFTMTELQVPAGVKVRFTGSRPVVLAVYGDARVQGGVTASSLTRADGSTQVGAGAGSAECSSAASGTGVMGGAGAGYGSAGAAGGATGISTGGALNGQPAMSPLRGGCPGGSAGGAGGLGGGGLQLSVAGVLTVTDGGFVASGGQGGQPAGTASLPGGGGGSGGALRLEAERLVCGGGVFSVNGGGGAQGGDGASKGTAGDDGAEQSPTVAHGGTGVGTGGTGGAGAAGAAVTVEATAGLPGTSGGTVAGGGGGAGLGRVWVSVRSCTDGGTFPQSTVFGGLSSCR